ncbi:MAG: subclass B3 metallo-beta-lactamase [Acidobacteriota bacterium]|nr:subclass B3 metallo-beta-lactamase [Acidobacteriota bacterium]
MKVLRVLTAALVMVGITLGARPAAADEHPEWTTPFPAFRIAGNLYYVGSKDLASYLVVTPQGNILINSSLESSPALIQRSIESLGFKLSDTRILLLSHAHWDHDAGSAKLLQATGAKYMVMDGDVPVVESGGKADFYYGATTHYPPARVDRVLHDGDVVELGGTRLVAHKTPGHTRGCTTWTMQVREGGAMRNVVIVGSWNVNPGFRLVDLPGRPASYPGIAADYQRTFRTLASLPCDIFLGAHGAYFNMLQKYARLQQGAKDVWVDPAGYRAAVAERQAAFLRELHRQQASGR